MSPLIAREQGANVIRLLIADDHGITREGTRRLLDAEPDIEVVAEAADGEQAVRLAEAVKPDLLLLDIAMPVLDGVQVAQRIRHSLPGTRIVILTGYDNEQYAPALYRLGVRGYLSKTASSGELLRAIRTVNGGQSYFQPSLASLLQIEQGPQVQTEPTPRELEVLRLVAEGRRNWDIAKLLNTSERTVQFHLSNLFVKLGAASRTETVYQARKRGWIT